MAGENELSSKPTPGSRSKHNSRRSTLPPPRLSADASRCPFRAFPGATGIASPPALASNRDVLAGLARLLIERGVDVNTADDQGDTALSYALKRGDDTPLVAYLREMGARAPNRIDRGKAVPSRAVPSDAPARETMIRERVQRSIDLIQPSSRAFLNNSFVRNQRQCTSCHHQALPTVAFSLARERGLRVDELELGRTLHAITQELASKTESARQMIEPVPNSRVTLGYDLEALQAVGYPPDEMTDAMSRHLLAWQDRGGSWHAAVPRGPMEDQGMVGTAWSIRALQLYPPRGREREVGTALRHARAWLLQQQPPLLNDQVFQLLGLAWAEAPKEDMRPFAEILLVAQRPDGGWAQLAGLDSEAWSTGAALVALHKAGIPPSHPAYQRGIDFLLSTQFDDGSWWVRSRSWPTQPHFDAQFPHGKDQWISAAGTAWAAIALLLPLEPVVNRRQLPAAPELISTFLAAPPSAPPPELASDASTAALNDAVNFARDISPLIERSCANCHVGKKIKGGFSLASREQALKGGQSGEPAIVPGRSGESQLLRYISDEIEDLEMPPLAKRDKFPALNDDEIARVRAWIDSGASWDDTSAANALLP